MLTACFDAAGKVEDKKTPVILVAGFSSIASVWTDFENQWSAVLDKFSVTHFHAGDFAHSKKPFERFKDDETARRELVSPLLNIIRGCGLRKFGAVIKKTDFLKARASMGLETDATVDPYVLCSRSTVDDLYTFAKGEGIVKNIATVFEKGDPEDRRRKHFEKHGFPDPDFAWNREVYKKGRLQRKFLGLQAAGWIAWEYYLDFCRVSGLSEHPPTEKGRVALQAFESMTGYIKIPYLSRPFDDLLRQTSESFQKSFRVVHDATQRLEAAKRSGKP